MAVHSIVDEIFKPGPEQVSKLWKLSIQCVDPVPVPSLCWSLWSSTCLLFIVQRISISFHWCGCWSYKSFFLCMQEPFDMKFHIFLRNKTVVQLEVIHLAVSISCNLCLTSYKPVVVFYTISFQKYPLGRPQRLGVKTVTINWNISGSCPARDLCCISLST